MQPKNFLHAIALALVMHFGVLAGHAQASQYLFSGSETTISLNSGTYDITAYGAQGGTGAIPFGSTGGLGAEMSGEFYFSANTMLTLLVGGVGAGSGGGGGGGGGSYVVNGSTPLVIAGGGGGGGTSGSGGSAGSGNGGSGGGGFSGSGGGGFSGGGGSFLSGGSAGFGEGGGSGGYGGGAGGFGGAGGGGGYSGGGGGAWDASDVFAAGGGGSIINSSAVAIITEVSGIASPDDSTGNGEIIITAVPEPTSLALAAISVLPLLLFRRQRERLNL